ncbi:sodium-dependent transporter [Corynebacterium freiburgense]|uniref:sodium-dependent transporter n=1 Tax=Corynebacterium freiburgense TaxID=556548 RepID=UPI000428D7A4|nr:sodium-dependent transporter [Corynebacterium freiburgense]WJZ02210.1 Sodium:neurotransmitter symporter family protein [Corynebacterium freiburgense]
MAESPRREVFSTRIAFLLAAIGSAVGLGNIWRFPYVAYDNGGGAFLVPYMVALLTAGIPLLFLDYTLGHRYRGSAPLVFRRIKSWAEPIGWVQVGIAFFITIYYAAVIAWAALYTVKSFNLAWGEKPEEYFFADFLQVDAETTFSFSIVGQIAIALGLVWVLAIVVLAMGVDEGIGKVSKIFMPILTVLFIIVVVQALFLPGAATGLNAFFTPEWSTLSNPSVWVAAYGQIFFSLSVGFGIMLTYSSYLKPRTNLTGTGLVTAFANSSFEVLAGIGVFAALGFMATQQGVAVNEVASSGIGLAFIAFPAIINEMPLGPVFGTLFFGSLTIAGFTSLFSLFEVVVSAAKDKFGKPRKNTAVGVGVIMALISLALFSTTSSLVTLDIMDKFTNQIGIVAIALITVVVVDWVLRRVEEFALHLNAVSSFKVGNIWRICVVNITTIVLGYTLIQELITLINEPYEGYSAAQLGWYGWGVLFAIVLASLLMSIIPWQGNLSLVGPPGSDFGVDPDASRSIGQPRKYSPQRAAGFAAEQYKDTNGLS